MAGILFRYRLAHPRADAGVSLFVLPVTGYHAVLLAHTRADKAKFTAAVRGLIEVHKVHINAVPRQGGIELGMELQQRLVEDREAVDPHFRRREGVQPHHQPGALLVIVGIAADGGDLIRRGSQRLQRQFAGQFRFCVEGVNHLLGMMRHLLQGFRPVQVLAANNEPNFILVENSHDRVLNGLTRPAKLSRLKGDSAARR